MSLNLDLSGVQEQGATVPAGKYTCVVEKAEVKTTKTGGEMIAVQLKILDQGPWFGKSIFDNFNIKNSNPLAVQIGLGSLKTMMKAAKHANPNKLETTQELMGLKMVVSTKVESDPQYGENVRVKGYAPVASEVKLEAGQTANNNPFA